MAASGAQEKSQSGATKLQLDNFLRIDSKGYVCRAVEQEDNGLLQRNLILANTQGEQTDPCRAHYGSQGRLWAKGPRACSKRSPDPTRETAPGISGSGDGARSLRPRTYGLQHDGAPHPDGGLHACRPTGPIV